MQKKKANNVQNNLQKLCKSMQKKNVFFFRKKKFIEKQTKKKYKLLIFCCKKIENQKCQVRQPVQQPPLNLLPLQQR